MGSITRNDYRDFEEEKIEDRQKQHLVDVALSEFLKESNHIVQKLSPMLLTLVSNVLNDFVQFCIDNELRIKKEQGWG